MTKCVALEFAKQNIRVNTVSPAAIATDMIDRFAGKEGEARDALMAMHPVGRFGKTRGDCRRRALPLLGRGEVHHGNFAQGRWRLVGPMRSVRQRAASG